MRIPQAVLDAIAAHARRDQPHECCGLLIGDAERIVDAVPTQNVADDPARRYQIAPDEYFAQIRRCRELTARGGPRVAVIGAYHSHPHSMPDPSPTDLREAFQDFLFLIVGPAARPDPLISRAYRLAGGVLRPVALTTETNSDSW